MWGLGEGMAEIAASSVSVESNSSTVSVGGSSLTLRWAWATHAGLVRAINEDAVLAEPGLFVVCDGMGGHRGGKRASELAVGDLLALAPGAPPQGVREVASALRNANDHVLSEGNSDPDLLGRGTTAALLALVDNGGRGTFVVANVGDSRTYRLEGDDVSQVSTDHSVIQELLDAGEISLDDIAAHRDRHVVTRVIGSEPPPEVDLWIFDPTVGQRFLLCSDGVHGEVRAGDIDAALRLREPSDTVRALIDAAFAAGARDNLSAVVVDVVSRVDELTTAPDDTLPREAVTSLAASRSVEAMDSPVPISEVPGV